MNRQLLSIALMIFVLAEPANAAPPVRPLPAPTFRVVTPTIRPSTSVGIGINIGSSSRYWNSISPLNINTPNFSLSLNFVPRPPNLQYIPAPTPVYVPYVRPITNLTLNTLPENVNPIADTGMRIEELQDNMPAKEADLRKGDIIIGVGKLRTRNFAELKLALTLAKGETDIIFINAESGKLERLPMTPVDGKIGISVKAIALP